MSARPPALSGPPLWGHLPELRADWLGLLARASVECGDAAELNLFGRRLWVICRPEWVRQVLIDEADAFDKGPTLRDLAGRFLGSGLITVPQPAHGRLRALVAPAFAPRRLAGYRSLMAQEAERASSALHDGQNLDLYDHMTTLTIRTIGRALFSQDLDESEHAIRQALDWMLAWITDRVQRPWRLPWSVPTPRNRRARAAKAQLSRTFAALVANRRACPDDRDDVLAALLAAQADGLTDAELLDQLATLCVAGFETTASTLTWAFALLAAHPDVERAVAEEAVDDGAAAGAASLTRRVLDETLRLYPAAHTLGRRASRDVAIGPYQMRAGALLVISPWQLHRRSEDFPDPERFDPDRWLRRSGSVLPRCAYLPFGAGPRACLGGQFALLQMQTTLTTLLRDWQFQSRAPGMPSALVQVTLRPRGLPVHVIRREARPTCASL